jgi:hypothetical protein
MTPAVIAAEPAPLSFELHAVAANSSHETHIALVMRADYSLV